MEHAISGASLPREAKLDSADYGWIVMSIGMAIGAGIVFLPIQVGVSGLWVFLLSSVIGYPAMYLFQKLFINTLAEAKECNDYTSVLTSYLGKNWGALIGALYFVMLIIWVFVYSLAVTNDSASYLHTYHITATKLSDNSWYGLVLISALAFVATIGKRILFKLSGTLAVTVLALVALMGVLLMPQWSLSHLPPVGDIGSLIKNAIITLPFTITSILFIQSLSPMVIFYRSQEKSVEVARFKALRAMKISFSVLFVVVFFYAVSFTLAISQAEALHAKTENISALAIIAYYFPGSWATMAGIVINIFAVVTSFFGVFLGIQEASKGIAMNLIKRFVAAEHINEKWVSNGVIAFIILLAWGAIASHFPILSFTSISSPIFGLVGCLIPAYLVYRVPMLAKYRSPSTIIIIVTGVLLVISPLLTFIK